MNTMIQNEMEVAIGSIALIPLGEGRTFRWREQSIAVYRQRDGAIFATEAVCPHSGGPLAEGVVGGCSVICPLHSYRFNLLTGSCINDPALQIRTFPVREADGQVFVKVFNTSA